MDPLRSQYGYDVAFISEVPDYLHCLVCRLVLRDPVMVMACGHKFCQTCFACLKQYAGTMKVELRCPVDMNVIDSTKVCEDFGLQRAIGCLLVQCGNSSLGCSWEGELSELPSHEKKCSHNEVKTSDHLELLAIVKDLQTRIKVCEESLIEKDSDIAELKLIAEDKTREMEALKGSNVSMQQEIDTLKGINASMQENTAIMQQEIVTLKESNLQMSQELIAMKEGQDEQQRKLNETITMMNEHADSVKSQAEANHQAVMTNRSDVLQMVRTRLEELLDAQMQGCSFSKAGSFDYPPTRLLLQHYIGDPKNTTITTNNMVTFHRNWSTVALPQLGSSQGPKLYYEVTFHGKVDKRTSASSYVGWATAKFQPCQKREYRFVGDSSSSWGYSGQERYKHHRNKYSRWGVKLKCTGEQVLGVGVDLDNGQLLYSYNGSWDTPMGVAFEDVGSDLELFPVITGYNIKLSVNFGDAEFKYGPPDSTYCGLVTSGGLLI